MRQRGATSVELTIALIVVLLLGLGVLQFVFLYQARLAIEQAVVEAARSGSTGHASDEALRRGLARGLAPLLYGADDAADLQVSEARALTRIATGQADGSITLRRLNPTDAAFADWEEPALDAFGEAIEGQVEIPNDNLDVRRTRSQPASGIAGHRGSEPIGAGSGVTLVDANLLRVELVYGMRLTVPVAGRALATMLRGWNGCSAGPAVGAGQGGGGAAAAELCPHLLADPPRLPLRAVATIRMMSPARRAAGGGAGGGHGGGAGAGTGGGMGGAGGGTAGSGQGGQPDTDGAVPGGGSSLVAIGEGSGPEAAPGGSPDGQAGRGGRGGRVGGGNPGSSTADRLGNGFLGIGSDRSYPHPAVCAET